MKRWLRNRKAVSPVIAALLLIAISVAAAVITYSWVMSMIKTQGKTAQTNIGIDMVEFTGTAGASKVVKVTIRNKGSIHAIMQTIYITHPGGTVDIRELSEKSILPGGSFTFVFDGSAYTDLYTNWVPSKVYGIKAVTDTGFAVEGTYYSPGL